MNLLLLSLFVSAWTIGLSITTWENMLFAKADRLKNWLPTLLYKPLIGCVYCMPSLHTAALLLVWSFKHGGLRWELLLYWGMIAVPAVAINALIYPLIVFIHHSNEKLEKQAAYLQKKEEQYAKHQTGSGTGMAADEPATQRRGRYHAGRNNRSRKAQVG